MCLITTQKQAITLTEDLIVYKKIDYRLEWKFMGIISEFWI